MSTQLATRSDKVVEEKKVISISTKRQLTIPLKYYELLGFNNEAECIMKDDGLYIRPVQTSSSDFSDLILEDLVSQGYSGQELVSKFKEQHKKIRPAVEKMLEEADDMVKKGEGKVQLDELFDVEDD
jgi:hypothetical protein